jgi:CheY-like chemotaxis protein
VRSLHALDDGLEAGWRPELVVVDMHLDHGDDGVSIVRRVRARFGDDLPAIVVTGDVSTATREAIAAAGLPALEKPVSALRLRAALTLLVQRD